MPPAYKIDIWHNILWSSYKGEVFSSLYEMRGAHDIRFFQIAETETARVGLSKIDQSRHRYPYELLFEGAYQASSLWQRMVALGKRTWKTDADITILTGFERPEVWVQLLILKLRRKKVGVFCDSTTYDRTRTFLHFLLKSVFFTRCDLAFCYGDRSRQYLAIHGIPLDRIHFRCQAAALPHGYNSGEVVARRVASAPPADRPRFLYVGRLSPEKGLISLLQAFSVVRERIPAAELTIIGSGPQRDELAAVAGQLGLNADSILIGSKSGDALFDAYGAATCFVLPSLSEPWGLVVNEAYAYGCPAVVSYNCGCVPELLASRDVGLVHRPNDVADLAEKMLLATQTFADVARTAQRCLDVISEFVPGHAAQQILTGVEKTLQGAHTIRQN